MAKTDQFRYSWEETETNWQKYSPKLAAELGIPLEVILESRIIVKNALGEEWLKNDLNNSSKTQNSKTMSEVIAPSVTKLISNPITTSAVQIVELARYLTEAKDQEKLKLALDILRNPGQFEAGRLNLAMFYRFSQSEWTDLVLEPDIPRGKGDFSGKFDGKNYLVECSILENDDSVRVLTDQLNTSLQNAVKDQVLEVGIEIEFKKPADKDSIAQTIRSVREARNLFGKGEIADVSDKIFTSSVASGRVFKLSETDKTKIPDTVKWDNIFAISYAKPLEDRDVYSIDLDSTPRTGMIFIKGLEVQTPEKSFYDRLKTKVEAKLSQTHGLADGIKRIFVIMTEDKVENYDWDKVWEYLRPLTSTRANLSAILLVDRRASQVNGLQRFAYPQIHFVNNKFDRLELTGLFSKLEKLERSDWIKDHSE